MDKLFAGLGLILIFVGLITSAIANVKYENSLPPQSVATAESSWSVAANFSAGERFRVNIVGNATWTTGLLEAPTESYPYGYLDIFLEIIDPYGDKTIFTFTWMRYPTKEEGTYVLLPADLIVKQNGSLINPGLYVWNPAANKTEPGGCGGTARYEGTYIANITGTMPPIYFQPSSPYYAPPAVIELVKENLVFSQPFAFALPLGIVSFIGGIAASVYGIKSKEKTSRRKRR